VLSVAGAVDVDASAVGSDMIEAVEPARGEDVASPSAKTGLTTKTPSAQIVAIIAANSTVLDMLII